MMNPVDKEEESLFHVDLRKTSPHHYMKVHLELEDKVVRLNTAELTHFIVTGLRTLHGEVGAALNFDVLKFHEDTLTALLRVPSGGLMKLWSSLTLLGFYQNKSCAFRVLQVSPSMLTLSRTPCDLPLD